MLPAYIFLVIDFHPESRFLLARTLSRKFPAATVRECDDADSAIQLARTQDIAAIVTHRTFDVAGADLVRQLREVDPDVPIVMVSGIDREEAAVEAGASSFMPYDEWLRIGSVVEQLLNARADNDDEKNSPQDQVA